MKAKTYDEWLDVGYHVIRGEKSTGRNKDGKPTFTRDQVEESEWFDNLESRGGGW